MDKKPLGGAPIAITVTVLIAGLLLGVYVGGYFWLGELSPHSFGDQRVRIYPYQWLATAYKPAAFIETAMTGRAVTTM